MLRELTLSYDLNNDLLQGLFAGKFKNVTVNVTGTNLIYFSGYSGNFPEVGGFDQGKFPLPKRLTFGVRVNL
jgi:hypothetical protein